jgi:anaerobic selenocysteine-containing dehydrogenase
MTAPIAITGWAKKKTTPALSATNKGNLNMELNRRNFIKFVVGGAVGINLSPLPWKFTDDIAIWSQNWSWVPVPERGEYNHVQSVCKLCPGGCGIDVRTVGTRAVKIENRTDYPVNPGGLCPLGEGGLQLLYDQTARFTGPMKRVGPRGAGVFMDISWDEALGILAERISDLRKSGTPQALAAVDGNRTGSTMSVLVERLLHAVGSPNYERVPTVEETYRMTNVLMQGTEGPMACDLENADYVLSFDAGLIEGWGAPARVINAWKLWHEFPVLRKARIVQVQSRASTTASKADQWVAVKPGTGGALALGMAHVLIKEGLYDPDFVNNYSFGFNDWTSADGKNHLGFKTLVLKKYSPAQVAEVTGLESEEIVSLAVDFARAKAPIAVSGKDKGYLNASLYECMAVQSLNALVGNINKPGGVLVADPLPLSPLPAQEPDETAGKGLQTPRIDQAGGTRYPFTHSLINLFSEAIIQSQKSPVDTVLVFSANPVFTLPDAGTFRKALTKVPFIVSFSPYQDETAYMADLILPDHTYLEKTDDIVWPTGLQYPLYGLTKPVVEPVYDTKNAGDTLIKLAGRIGESVASAFPWKNYEEVLKARAQGLFEAGGLTRYDSSVPVWERLKEGGTVSPNYKSFDDMWKQIKSGGLWYKPAHVYGNWDKLFKTPTGKFEFFSTQIELALNKSAQRSSEAAALKEAGVKVTGDEVMMPRYETVSRDVDRRTYPLTMVPYGIINLSSGWLPNPPFLYKTLSSNQLRKRDSFAEINPKTAEKYDLKEGDPAVVSSPKGEVRVRVHLFEGAMPGVVYMPFGFGHTAYDEFSRDKGANPNNIISADKEPLTGYPVWWETPVKLTKA